MIPPPRMEDRAPGEPTTARGRTIIGVIVLALVVAVGLTFWVARTRGPVHPARVNVPERSVSGR